MKRLIVFCVTILMLSCSKNFQEAEIYSTKTLVEDPSRYIVMVAKNECPAGFFWDKFFLQCRSAFFVDTTVATGKYMIVYYSDSSVEYLGEHKEFRFDEFFPKDTTSINWDKWVKKYEDPQHYELDQEYPIFWNTVFANNYPVAQPCCILGDATLNYGTSLPEISITDYLDLYDLTKSLKFTLYITQPKPYSDNIWHYNELGEYNMGRVFVGLEQETLSTTFGLVPNESLKYITSPSNSGIYVDASEQDYNLKISFTVDPSNIFDLFLYIVGHQNALISLGGFNSMTWGLGSLQMAGYPNPTIAYLAMAEIQDFNFAYCPGPFVNNVKDQIAFYPYCSFGYGTTPANSY